MTFQDWIKLADTSDESVPSDVGVDFGHGGATDDTGSAAASEDSARANAASRRRRIALWTGLCGIIVVAIAIGVVVVMTTGAFQNDSSQSPEDSHDFDFTGINGTSPTEKPASTLSPTTTQSSINDSPTTAQTTPPSPTSMPSFSTTKPPTGMPTSSMMPSSIPSDNPSDAPSIPTIAPTATPTAPIPPVPRPPTVDLNMTSDTLMTFCVIADVPYDKQEAEELPGQIATQMDGCEFMVHLGDLFEGDTMCEEDAYFFIRDVMLESEVPTFVVLGDNEWNDCQRSVIDLGWERWTTNFLRFENYWPHNFTVVRQPGYEENFYFVHKHTLIIGLNIVGGRLHNQTEWHIRMKDEFDWVRDVINNNVVTGNSDGVILMAHAKPTADHAPFFDPFRDYIRDELQNEIPILYLHGDGHDWMYTPHFKNQSSLLRIQHEGGTNEPILKIHADPRKHPDSVYNAFQYDRQLELLRI